MGRTAQILSLALKELEDIGERKVTREELVYHLNDVQNEIAERTILKQSTKYVTLIKDRATYALDQRILRIDAITPPDSWSKIPELVTDVNRWIEITTELVLADNTEVYGITIPSTNPEYLFLWGDNIEVYPVPILTGERLKLSTRVYPAPITIENSGRGDPDLPVQADKPLRLGLIAAVVNEPNGKWEILYEAEMKRLEHLAVKAKSGAPQKTRHTSDRLGF